MDARELADVERQAVEIAWAGGRMLLARFHQPLEVKWKGKNAGDDPVTDADHQVESYIREELARRFPTHALVGEEGSGEGSKAAPCTWVVDPLDGTTNFLNGLPAFACSLGLLEHGRPVAGAVFIPWPTTEGGMVVHARAGGGAWADGRRLELTGETPLPGRLVVLARGPFRMREPFRRGPGERRSVGSTAYELAVTALGVYRYVLFGAPKVWDVAAGVLLVSEAGGRVMTLRARRGPWAPLGAFTREDAAKADGAPMPGQEELRKWASPVLAGTPNAVELAVQGITPYHPMIPGAVRALRRALGLRRT
jgi:myo-inositol-1(or 4)-monophosphatase